MKSKNTENNNIENISEQRKKSRKISRALIAALAAAVLAASFTGCGLLIGGSLGDYKVFEGLSAQYNDIQLQTESSNEGNTDKEPPQSADSVELDLNEGANTSANSTPFTDVVKETKKSVVEINTETVTYSQWSGQYIVTGAGSGVIISKSPDAPNVYHIVTNHHVVDNAKTITVILHDGTKYEAEVLGFDEITDIALLEIEVQSEKELSVATLANENNVLLDGQEVYAVGNPLGKLGGSVSKGIISNTARKILINGIKMELMQIDAAVNPGNSGGGLFDVSGNLVGIVNAKYSDEGIEGLGFAIPINTVKAVVLDLAEYGFVKGRPSLGFEMKEIAYPTGSYFASSSVVYPTVVSNDDGIFGVFTDDEGNEVNFEFKENDIILGVNGTEVNSVSSLQSHLVDLKAGDSVTLQIKRVSENGREYKDYSVRITINEESFK